MISKTIAALPLMISGKAMSELIRHGSFEERSAGRAPSIIKVSLVPRLHPVHLQHESNRARSFSYAIFAKYHPMTTEKGCTPLTRCCLARTRNNAAHICSSPPRARSRIQTEGVWVNCIQTVSIAGLSASRYCIFQCCTIDGPVRQHARDFRKNPGYPLI